MTVVRPNSIAGINSITVQTGQALNIHDASGNLIRNITSSTGISTFQSVEITKGTGDLTVGVSTFFVDNSATNVGVGTNVPYNNAGTNVHIHSGNTTSEIRFTNSTTGGGNNGGTIQQGGTTLYVSNSEAGNIAFENNGSERVRIDSSGQLVIGSTSGEAKLDVTGGVSISSNGVTVTPSGYDLKIRSNTSKLGIHCDSGAGTPTLEFGTGGSTGCFINDLDATPMRFGTHNTERMRIRGDGRVSIASSLAVTGVTTAAAFIPSKGQLSNRNIVINGAMQVAQRATSNTDANQGYKTVDRFTVSWSGLDSVLEQHQVVLTSGTPYNLGFKYAWQLKNGDQTGGAGTSDYIQAEYRIEARDLAQSGWDYVSSSSYITLSFWMKTSVSQDYTINLTTRDGTSRRYPMKTGTIAADTWTKITKTIPGDSNITIDNDTGDGMAIMFYPYLGNNYVGSSSINAWSNAITGNFGGSPDTAWYTTNDATFEVTGFQVEVGEHATPFEHRSFAEDLRRCQRYFQRLPVSSDHVMWGFGRAESNSARVQVPLSVPLRAAPSITCSNFRTVKYDGTMLQSTSTPTVFKWDDDFASIILDFPSGGTQSHNNVYIVTSDGGTTGLQISSEL